MFKPGRSTFDLPVAFLEEIAEDPYYNITKNVLRRRVKTAFQEGKSHKDVVYQQLEENDRGFAQPVHVQDWTGLRIGDVNP